MKKLFVCAFAVAALTASAALAAPPATHPGNGAKGGKPLATGASCKPQIMVVLHGAIAATPGASPTLPFGLQVTVKSTNAHGKAFVDPIKQPVTITVTSSTRIVRQGKASLSSLVVGDQVTVQARSCKADLAQGAALSLTARMIVARPAGSTSGPSDLSPTTTTTTTTTTSS